MVKNYNSTKFGVDIFDEMLNNYSYSPSVKRWPLRLFMSFLVSGASINAHVLHGTQSTRREFTHKLAEQLMEGVYNGLRSKILGDEKTRHCGATFAIKSREDPSSTNVASVRRWRATSIP
uniref:PiggyBac transposable element-derived protein domain-containing protein n=1 Tax=Ditylenchus dipsaci TaxID=166011 RepID=A0A915DTM6_9BILA